MAMKKLSIIAIILVVMASGCLFRPPAKVTFSVDKTAVYPGDIFHIIVTINNTGKVGITDANLIISGGDFRILQKPEFPKILKVGDSVQLVWVVQAPKKPGIYSLQVSLEIRDELKRTWTGFYESFRITVTKENTLPTKVSLTINASREVRGGSLVPMLVTIKNNYDCPVKILDIKVTPLPGMKVRRLSEPPSSLGPREEITLKYEVSAPYSYRKGFVSVILSYRLGDLERTSIASFPMEVIWRPWQAGREDLIKAYGDYYNILLEKRIVDKYWEKKFNSTSTFNVSFLRPIATAIVGNASSEYEAAWRLYEWVSTSYRLSTNTTTLSPDKIFRREEISPAEEQILLTAFLRSLKVPARIVSLFDGEDCTLMPITEFYTADGWGVVDAKHGFVGTLNDYLASPYFPRVYQLISKGYRVVAQTPKNGYLHEHEDITKDFTSNLDSRIYNVLRKRVKPQLIPKLDMVLSGLSDEERLYALFLFASAPEDELNKFLSHEDVSTVQKTIKALYEFYRDIPWKENFRVYWNILRG